MLTRTVKAIIKIIARFSSIVALCVFFVVVVVFFLFVFFFVFFFLLFCFSLFVCCCFFVVVFFQNWDGGEILFFCSYRNLVNVISESDRGRCM